MDYNERRSKTMSDTMKLQCELDHKTQEVAKLQAELDREKKERSDLYIEYTMLRDRFGECFEYNQNCIDEIAQLKRLIRKAACGLCDAPEVFGCKDCKYYEFSELKEKDNE
jgi:chromosome segregation ATPase